MEQGCVDLIFIVHVYNTYYCCSGLFCVLGRVLVRCVFWCLKNGSSGYVNWMDVNTHSDGRCGVFTRPGVCAM